MPDLVGHITGEGDGVVVVVRQPWIHPLLPEGQVNVEDVAAGEVNVLNVGRDLDVERAAGLRAGPDLVVGVHLQPHRPANWMQVHHAEVGSDHAAQEAGNEKRDAHLEGSDAKKPVLKPGNLGHALPRVHFYGR